MKHVFLFEVLELIADIDIPPTPICLAVGLKINLYCLLPTAEIIFYLILLFTQENKNNIGGGGGELNMFLIMFLWIHFPVITGTESADRVHVEVESFVASASSLADHLKEALLTVFAPIILLL
ncbi:hypothetical protein ACJX0J_030660 [Zea mays]